jgi:hypothetical protein
MITASVRIRANEPSRSGLRSHAGRRAIWLALAVPAVCVGLVFAVAWNASDQILTASKPSGLHEQQVFAAGPGWVRLSRDGESLQPGTWALQWETGYGWVGRVLATNDAGVVREYRPTLGTLPVGGWASLRGVSKIADPRSLFGLAFSEVAYDGPLGSYPAWRLPGSDTTWVIYVHGRGANRAEALRSVSALSGRGLPGLVITYRNDAGAPRAPDGYSHLGASEWADLEGAARYALAHGAHRLVLIGYSMGGQVVLQFLSHSALAWRVSAVVLESAMLDWNAGLAHRAEVLRAPFFALPLGKRLASWRAGLDWSDLDRVARTTALPAPVLAFHGTRDRYAPSAVTRAFARKFPNEVTVVLYSTGNHVEAWNVDPERYTSTLNGWLTSHGVGGGAR